MWKCFFGLLLAGLIFVGCTSSTATEETSDTPEMAATELIPIVTDDATSQPDRFELTATSIIANATQTAVAFVNTDCIQVERPVWDIHEAITDRETQTFEVFVESYTIDAWVCDGELTQTRPLGDYSIYLVTLEETITLPVAAELVERALELLTEYPPDDTMMQPISVNIFAFPNVTISDVATAFVLETEFTYEDAIAAYESGLRGEDLLEALGIEVPE